MTGHLFIVNGDLTKIACDAILIPTDGGFSITGSWGPVLAGRDLPVDWGAAKVVPVDFVRNEPWIWLGNVGQRGHDSNFEDFEPTIREFVEKASAAVQSVDDSDRIYRWPKRRLAVNVVGSGKGGGSQKKGDLLRGLVTNLQELSALHDVDIVLVTWGDKSYAAAQRARHQLMGDCDLALSWKFTEAANGNLINEARALANAAIDSRLVLFIGAGVSAGAGLPTWQALLSEIALQAGIEPEILDLLRTKDLRDQATLLERRLNFTGDELRRRIAASLRTKQKYSLQHAQLASLPSREAITTNFDTLFEEVSRAGGRALAVLPEDPSQTGGRWLLKLHGTVDEPQRMVLTRSDYLDMPRRYGALIGLVQGLLLMRHMMFVGYSLSDEDFHELMYEVRAARGDAGGPVRGTVLTLFDDRLERELWDEDLHVVAITNLAPTERESVPDAARELEVFLDLVGFLSTTSAAFFLDATYDSLSADEADLRGLLTELMGMTRGAPLDSVAHKVDRFLRELGATENNA